MPPARNLDLTIRPLLRAEYDRLVADGCFADDAVELLWGSLVRMSAQKSPHAAAIQFLNHFFVPKLFPDHAAVRVQLPFAAADDSEPEPDLALVPPGSYRDEHPDKALLTIEVAETTLATDRAKAELYAAASVPEYWIVNLVDQVVEVHRLPWTENGRYRSVITLGTDAELAPEQFAEHSFSINELLRG